MFVGIDAVEINRFKNWDKYSKKQLCKLLNDSEIETCLKNKSKISQKFATHFAVKEAFFKALCTLTKKKHHFFHVCKNITLYKNLDVGYPYLQVEWRKLLDSDDTYKVNISITHTNNLVITNVIIF